MLRFTSCLIGLWMVAGVPAFAKDVFDVMPAALVDVARDLDKDCKSQGLGHVIKSDNYGLIDAGLADLDRDGKTDYVVYNCMFGCSDKPNAFTGIASPCPWGSLLLSGELRGKRVFIPGVVTRIYDGDPVTLVVTRPRILRLEGNYCSDPQPTSDPQHLYKLQGDKILLVSKCPDGGCQSLASNIQPAKTKLSPLPFD